MRIEETGVTRSDLCLDAKNPRQPLHLRAAERRIEIRQTVVVASLVVNEFVGMRNLGGRCDVLGSRRQLAVIRQDHAAGAGGDHLVAVEAQRRKLAEPAGMASATVAAQRFGSVLDHWNAILVA